MANIYKPRHFAALVGRSVNTLQRWDRDGILTANRTPTNRRFYTHKQYIDLIGSQDLGKKVVAYLRTSRCTQGGELEKQRIAIEQFCIARGIVVDIWLQDVSSSLDYSRKSFNKLMQMVMQQDIKQAIVVHSDRLVRFGFELLESVFLQNGAQIISLNTESLSPAQEVRHDFIRVLSEFAERVPVLKDRKKSIEAMLHRINTNSDILCTKWR